MKNILLPSHVAHRIASEQSDRENLSRKNQHAMEVASLVAMLKTLPHIEDESARRTAHSIVYKLVNSERGILPASPTFTTREVGEILGAALLGCEVEVKC